MSQVTAQQTRSRAMGLAVLSSLVSKGGNALLMLVSIPLAIRVLGEERFGVYGVVQTLMWFITMSDLGMGPGIMRRIVAAVARGDREEESAAVACGFFITLGFVLVAGILFCTLMLTVPVTVMFGAKFAPVEAELTQNLWMSGVLFLVMLMVSMLERSREGYQEIHIANAFGGTANLLAAGVLFFGIGMHSSVMFLLLAIYGMQAVASALNAGHLLWKRPWLIPKWSNLQAVLARQMVWEGMALFVAGSVAPILQREGTKWLLGQMEGPAAVGRFTILIQLGFFLYGFVFMVSRPLWPAVADAVARGDIAWVRTARRRMLRFYFPLAVLTVAGFTLLGPWLVDLWLKKHVNLERSDFMLFSLSFVFMIWSHLHYVMLAGSGSIRRPAVVLACETVAVLTLSWLGIRFYGLPGALAGTTAGTLLFSAWMLPRLLAKSLRPGGTGADRDPDPDEIPVQAAPHAPPA
jgi:O-antigen/teichoic acid export membrane protein